MRISKKLAALASTVVVSGIIAACGGGTTTPAAPAVEAPADGATEVVTEAGPKIGQTQLRLSFNQTAENPQAQTIFHLSDQIYDATDGRYSIELFPSEQLGNQADSLALVQAGALDMAIVANPLVENINPDFAILAGPFVWDSIDHQYRVLSSGDLDSLFAETQPDGFRVLAGYSLGPRNVYLRDGLIETPEDLNGKAIRVIQSDAMVQMMNLMGGVGTPMPQGEVYTAIQTGILDGAENNIITYNDLLQYEVAPYYIETNHLIMPDLLIISNTAFDGMSAEDQAAIVDLSRQSTTYMFERGAELRAGLRDRLEGAGVTFGTVDMEPFRARVQPLIDNLVAGSPRSAEIYEIINSHR